MSLVVILDSGPLGLASNPRQSANSMACRQWLRDLAANSVRVIIPEIADYEVRRELIRARKSRGLAHLDLLVNHLEYLPISTAAMHRAAKFWAQARQSGTPTAPDPALDGDVILAAQAATLGEPLAVVATTNTQHVSRFVVADQWRNIQPD